jgi:hypothetical protein
MLEPHVIAKIVQFLNTATLKPSDIPDFQAVMVVLEKAFMEAHNPPKPQSTDSDMVPL